MLLVIALASLGYVGHSLGGYTVVGLAGGWASWKTPGVKAVLALSPYTVPYLVRGTLGGVAAPVMYQGGTLDVGITPSVRKTGGVYDATPAPKYFVDFSRAGHFAWTDLRASAHDEITEYATAFLDHYVHGRAGSPCVDARHERRRRAAVRLRAWAIAARSSDSIRAVGIDSRG